MIFSARTDGKPFAEYIKTCPVKSGATAAALERQPGFEFAPMRFGDQFYATNLVRRQRPGDRVTLHPATNGSTEVVPLAPITRGGDFLRSYGYRQRSAVDELAYRLFGFAGLRDFQHEILRRVLTGKNVLGIAATGGGKSECFILPAMVMQGVTIVVSPLRSLMTDQYEQRLKDRYGLEHLATFINGEVPFQERQARLKRMELGYYKLVYFTPEQLERGWVLDFLARTDSKVGIRYLALDEAHCISHWDHDFRPSYLNILHRLTQRGINPKRIALTATASPHVRDDICKELMLDADDVFVHSSNRPEINLVVRVRDTAAEKGEEILSELRKLKRHNENNISPGAAIVFMPHTGKSPEKTQDYQGNENTTKGLTSSGATWFASYLERMLDQRVAIYHGEMDDQVSWESASPIVNGLPDVESTTATGHGRQLGDLSGRTRKQEQIAFINGDRNIMVATKGFGMGIDKPNVRLIIHRTPTSNLESYAQEAGRAGRDGEPATAMLFYAPPAKNPSQYQRQELSDNSDPFKERSDYDIQAFFVNRPYVRQCDVEVMRAFLMQMERRTTWVAATGAPASSIYFTNDEAIEFFDRCESDPAVYGFSWPKFEERLSRGRESPEHSAVLDRGHNYNEKTGYIGRILGVVNRIRSDMPGLQARPTLLQSFQQTGAHLLNLNLEALNWLGIIGSNSYFGDMLRDRGLSREEFVAFISGPDTLPLASRLSMSIRDTAALLEDIKHSGEQLHNSWRRDLLNYSWLEAPFYGPATGLGHLSQWRDYAGATTRSTKTQALLQANKRGWSNTKLTDDDWFGWKHVSKRVG
jgi:superfamily II DNA/RNA helicase